MSLLDDRPCSVFASFSLNLKKVPPYSFSDIPCPVCESWDFLHFLSYAHEVPEFGMGTGKNLIAETFDR